MKLIKIKIARLKELKRETENIKEKNYIHGKIQILKELENEMKINDNDLEHWCSYNGIQGENKDELLSIVKQ